MFYTISWTFYTYIEFEPKVLVWTPRQIQDLKFMDSYSDLKLIYNNNWVHSPIFSGLIHIPGLSKNH